MSDNIGIRLSGVGKMFKLFSSPIDTALDAFGLARLMPWRRDTHREFWALRDIDLELEVGSRIGIIGRNGAGKTTLLKLMTGNLAPTEGEIEVKGQVQALLDAGAAFHPEFTGYENIRASLTYQGLGPAEIENAAKEIADFTELGQFLDQPFKAYSAGMQARLAFATATAITPEILIIDEILGAGDAYFLGKSGDRMRQLVDMGASVLLVSHALDQVVRFCEEAIWLERGRIVKRGPSLEVVKAYQEFISVLDNRRLKAKNYKRYAMGYDVSEYELYSESFLVRFVLQGEPGACCDISEVRLLMNSSVEERLLIGDPQDDCVYHPAFVMLDGSNWSEPQKGERGYHRRLTVATDRSASVSGSIAFNLYVLYEKAEYAVEVDYRCSGSGWLSMEVLKKGRLLSTRSLPTEGIDRRTERIALEHLETENLAGSPGARGETISRENDRKPTVQSHGGKPSKRRWPGEGSLTIEEVVLLDANGEEQTVFKVGTPMILRMTIVAQKSGKFRVIPVAVIYRLDGIVVSQHWGAPIDLEARKGERRGVQLDFGPINLGNGDYVFSVGLFRKLDPYDLWEAEHYQIVDRSYEFKVSGNPPRMTGIFQHPGEWKFL